MVSLSKFSRRPSECAHLIELMPRSDRAKLMDFVKFNGVVEGSRKSIMRISLCSGFENIIWNDLFGRGNSSNDILRWPDISGLCLSKPRERKRRIEVLRRIRTNDGYFVHALSEQKLYQNQMFTYRYVVHICVHHRLVLLHKGLQGHRLGPRQQQRLSAYLCFSPWRWPTIVRIIMKERFSSGQANLLAPVMMTLLQGKTFKPLRA